MRAILLFFTISLANPLWACTIFSAKDHLGQVWAANNEDGAFTFYNYLNIFPKTEDTRYGYITFCYDSPKNGSGGAVQGGVNEAGLFYDFNFIKSHPVSNLAQKQGFPAGDEAILTHLLPHFSTVFLLTFVV